MTRRTVPGLDGKRTGFQFTLRALIATSTVAALVLAVVGHSLTRLRRHEALIARVQRIGGQVDYDDNFFVCLSLHRGYTAHEVIWLVLGSDPLTHVTTIMFDGKTPVEAADFALLGRFPRLTNLYLAGPTITDQFMPTIASLGSLRRLGLSGTRVTAAGLAELGTAKHLTSLRLSGSRITDGTLVGLRLLPQLRDLRLLHTQITSTGLASVAKTTQLQTLCVREAPDVNDRGLDHIKNLAQLEQLELSDTAVTDDGVRKLQHLAKLRMLDLSGTRISNGGLTLLLALPKLTDLRVTATHIDDVGLSTIGRIKNLQALRLGKTAITNTGLKSLIRLRDLQSLELWPTAVTAPGMQYLAQFHHLLSVSLGPRFSFGAARELKRRLPECEITLVGRNGEVLVGFPGATPPFSWTRGAAEN